jgi:hypothetical protein
MRTFVGRRVPIRGDIRSLVTIGPHEYLTPFFGLSMVRAAAIGVDARWRD